ncbi:MAG: hypothetical protein J2P53_03835, partial [Bradyrhizobiaceae bacterium]|nr:hypothetical protein [Bradyrhizobiaceae bacterium]
GTSMPKIRADLRLANPLSGGDDDLYSGRMIALASGGRMTDILSGFCAPLADALSFLAIDVRSARSPLSPAQSLGVTQVIDVNPVSAPTACRRRTLLPQGPHMHASAATSKSPARFPEDPIDKHEADLTSSAGRKRKRWRGFVHALFL